jgi:LysR substrate binding domain
LSSTGVAWRSAAEGACEIADGSPTLQERIRGRRVDLIIGPFTPGVFKDLDVTVLYRERLYVVAGKTSLWVRRRKITLADLVNERWVLPPPDHPIGSMVVDAFRRPAALAADCHGGIVTIHEQLDSWWRISWCLGVLGSAGLNDPRFPVQKLPCLKTSGQALGLRSLQEPVLFGLVR